MNDKTNMSRKHYIRQTISKVTKSKTELRKTVRLTGYQKPQLQSVPIFFQLCLSMPLFVFIVLTIESNLFKTDTKGTEPSVCFTEVSVLQANLFKTDTKGTESSVCFTEVSMLQANLFNTDTKGTKPSVRFTEVSVL